MRLTSSMELITRVADAASASLLGLSNKFLKSISRPAGRPITLEVSHGVHKFEISNYSHLRDLGINSFLRSGVFDVGGCAWSIRFYPCGHNSRTHHFNKDYVSVGVELMTKDAVVSVVFPIHLIDRATGARYSGVEVGTMNFNTCRTADVFLKLYFFNRVIRKTQLEASTFLRDDCVVIQCTLRVIKGTRVPEARAAPEINVPPSDLPDQLGRLLKEGIGTDVTFDVQGVSFPAHRTLLAARSPVFRAQLLGPMRDGTLDRVAIHEIQPEVFEALLHFIYTDSLPKAMDDANKDDQIFQDVLSAADRYAMYRLKLVCVQALSRRLTVENVSDTLIIADRHNYSGLKDACIRFMASDTRMK